MTKTPSESPARKSLRYAEETLGVNSVYENLLKVRDALDANMSEAAKLRDTKREIEALIEERELDISIEHHSLHADSSIAALDRGIKAKIPKDPRIQDLRSRASETVSALEGVEYDIRLGEHDIRIAVARMTELGGYFNYLTAIKQAVPPAATTPTTPEKPENTV